MIVGMGMPFSRSLVDALNALQNSMMLTPRWPSAGPIGWLGLALPAGTCSLIKPTIFFAIMSLLVGASGLAPSPVEHRYNFDCGLPLLRLLDLSELQFHRRRAAKDRHRYAQLRLVVVDVFDQAVKIGERAFFHAHPLAHFEQHL